MNRADRRRQDREFKKNLKTINKLTPAQTKIIDIAAIEKANKIANDKLEKFGQIIDRNMSAALIERGWKLEEIKKLQDRMSELLIEDTTKLQKFEKENEDIMKIEKEVKQAIKASLEKGISKKQAIDELMYKFPKLSKSMILNAYAKVKKEKGFKGNRVSKEDVYKYFTQHAGSWNGPKMIQSVMEEFNFTESTAQTYYYKWKKEYMAKEYTVKDAGCKKDKEKIIEEAEKILKEEVITKDETTNHTDEIEKKVQATVENTENKEVKTKGLKIKSMIVEGENGTYKVCENGVELQNEGLLMAFENVEQLDNFTKEFREVFNMKK